MEKQWTKQAVLERLKEIEQKGFIPVREEMFRIDDGIIGQVLEREFGVKENNLPISDLGDFELKGMRIRKGKSSKVTLFHQTSSSGLTPMEIFERFCYIKPCNRDSSMKRKLFTTVKGNRINNLGLTLRAHSECSIELYFHEEYLASWDLTNGKSKITQTVLVLAETQGVANSKEEKFHFVKAYLLSDPKNIYEAISSGAVVMEFCVDQPLDQSKNPHDRGPHVRIPFRKLDKLFGSIERIL